MQKEPEFRIYTGPMFGSKTTRMLAYLERCSHQNRKVVAFKPKMDERYSNSEIQTHAGLKFPAVNVDTGKDIFEAALEYDVIGVDEAFMIDGCAESLLALYSMGKTVVVSSIQLSATGKPFEEVKEMLPWATSVEVCPAVCVKTGNDAYFTVRKVDSSNFKIILSRAL